MNSDGGTRAIQEARETHLYFNGQRTRVDEERTDEMERIKLQSRGRDSKSYSCVRDSIADLTQTWRRGGGDEEGGVLSLPQSLYTLAFAGVSLL